MKPKSTQYSPAESTLKMYTPSPIDNYDHGIGQSMQGKRMWFSKQTGEIYKLNQGGIRQKASNDEIKEFVNNIFSEKIPLSEKDREVLEKYKNM